MVAPPPVVVEVETAQTEAGLVGEVVVVANAWLHAHPDSEIRFRLAAVEETPSVQDAVRFAVIADHGEWVELEAGRASEWPEEACMDADLELWELGLHLFVEREALLPVTAVRAEISFEDGTSVSLRPGTPIGPAREDDGWPLIDTWDATFHLPVPERVIGRSFTDWGGPRDQREPEYELRAKALLELGGVERLEMSGHPSEYLVGGYAPTRGGEALLVELDARCFHATARTALDNLLDPGGTGGLGLVGTGRGSGVPYTVAEGTIVYWADGSEAGRLRVAYHSMDPPTPRGQLRCFEELLGFLGSKTERRAELCYDAAAVVSPGES